MFDPIESRFVFRILSVKEGDVTVQMMIEDKEGTPLIDFGTRVLRANEYAILTPAYLIPRLGEKRGDMALSTAIDPDEVQLEMAKLKEGMDFAHHDAETSARLFRGALNNPPTNFGG